MENNIIEQFDRVFIQVGRDNAAGHFAMAHSLLDFDGPTACVDSVIEAARALDYADLTRDFNTQNQASKIFLKLADRARAKQIKRENSLYMTVLDTLRDDVASTGRCSRCGNKVNGHGAKSLDGTRMYCLTCQEDIIRDRPGVVANGR